MGARSALEAALQAKLQVLGPPPACNMVCGCAYVQPCYLQQLSSPISHGDVLGWCTRVHQAQLLTPAIPAADRAGGATGRASCRNWWRAQLQAQLRQTGALRVLPALSDTERPAGPGKPTARPRCICAPSWSGDGKLSHRLGLCCAPSQALLRELGMSVLWLQLYGAVPGRSHGPHSAAARTDAPTPLDARSREGCSTQRGRLALQWLRWICR